MKCIYEAQCFGGYQRVFQHTSSATKCDMEFAVYEPPGIASGKVPVVFFLSGLTCTWANVSEKSGAQCYAAEQGLLLVMPDTSPRGLDLPGEEEDWDFGSGASFYVNAVKEPWASHYQMFDYVTDELPMLVASEFPAERDRFGVMGHSMGGHGALISALKRPDVFRSCSVFAPISAPSNAPWGRKAFRGYLGDDQALWTEYDACELVADSAFDAEILVDQGELDPFLEEQLQPYRLEAAFRQAGKSIEVRLQSGYDHSYYFVSTFIGEHLARHAQAL